MDGRPDGQQPAYNITPDVVATVLGIIGGTLIAGLLPFAANFLSGSGFIWTLLIISIGAAAGHAWMCKHMGLSGWRLMRQAYALLIPLTVVLFTVAEVTGRIFGRVAAQLQSGTSGAQPAVLAPRPFSTLDIILLCIGVASVIIVIFFAEARRQEQVRLRWLWPLVVPVVLGALGYWAAVQFAASVV